MEQQGNEDQLLLRALSEITADGIITIDERGTIESVNPAAGRIFGYSSEEMVGQKVNVLMPEPDREDHDHYLERFQQTRKPHIIGVGREVTGRRKDGSEFPLRISVSEIKLSDRVLYAGILQDLTGFQTARQRVDELKRELELSELKSRFLNMASHEFRTPLGTIASAAEMIELNNGPDEAEKRKRHTDEIRNAVTRLTSVLNDFIALCKLRPVDVEPSPPPAAATGSPVLADPDRGNATLTAAFTESGQRQTYVQGEAIVRAGARARFLHRVESGHVHLVRSHEYGRDYILAEFGPGELFGLPAVLEQTTYPYTARAASTETVCQELPAGTVLSLVHSDPSVSKALMQLLSGWVVAQSDRLVHQAYDSVRRRTALVLCELHDRHEGEALRLSREELAQMVGSTKESVSRALSDFRKEGLIATRGRNVQLLDAAALRALLV